MARVRGFGLLLSIVLLAGAIHSSWLAARTSSAQVAASHSTDELKTRLDDNARLDFIRRAQIWMPTDIPSLDMRAGPGGAGAFQPNEIVTCDNVERRLSGSSPKFACALAPGDVVKVRYGTDNEEVQGSALATRLLWALGFAADRVYPVQVRCRGCTADPWHKPERVAGDRVFTPAVIERPPDGYELTDDQGKPGWKFSELDLVEETQGGASRAQRDALKLLAVFMQHTDTKSEQQRLLCLPGGLTAGGRCDRPVLMLHDVGLTFGRANTWNQAHKGSVNLDRWMTTPIWKDAGGCVGNLSKSMTGSLGDPDISEAGRQFLANLLVQLSDQQLADLFDIAGVARAGAPVAQWVAAFKQKRNEIVMARCRA